MTNVTMAMQQLNEDVQTTDSHPNFVPSFGGNTSAKPKIEKSNLGDLFWKPRLPDDIKNTEDMIKFVVRLLPNKTNTNPTISRKQFYVPSERSYIPMMDNGDECPMNQFRWKYWHEFLKGLTKDERKELQLGYDRITNYINVLVIDDPVNPENNNKIFIMPYTRQIEVAMLDSANMMEITNTWDCFTYEKGYNFNINVKVQSMPNGDYVPNYVKSMFAPKMTELTPEQKELAMNERYDLLDSIPDLRENLKLEYKDKIIKKMHETWGNSVNGVMLPTLGGDETTEGLPKGKVLLTETQPTTIQEEQQDEERVKENPKKEKTTMEKVADEQSDIKAFESKLDFNFT